MNDGLGAGAQLIHPAYIMTVGKHILHSVRKSTETAMIPSVGVGGWNPESITSPNDLGGNGVEPTVPSPGLLAKGPRAPRNEMTGYAMTPYFIQHFAQSYDTS